MVYSTEHWSQSFHAQKKFCFGKWHLCFVALNCMCWTGDNIWQLVELSFILGKDTVCSSSFYILWRTDSGKWWTGFVGTCGQDLTGQDFPSTVQYDFCPIHFIHSNLIWTGYMVRMLRVREVKHGVLKKNPELVNERGVTSQKSSIMVIISFIGCK